jgi:hypothetical protein
MKKLLLLLLLPMPAFADVWMVSNDYPATAVQPVAFQVTCTSILTSVPVSLDASNSNAVFFAYNLTAAGITTNAQLATCTVAAENSLGQLSVPVPFPAAFPAIPAGPAGLHFLNSTTAPTHP